MGPDEYHETVDDSAYTNTLARWNIGRALEVCALLRTRWPERWQELRTRLALDVSELALWDEVIATLVTGFNPATGIIDQFTGFFDLEFIDLAKFPDRTTPMDVQLGHERVARSQIVKQADVVALLGLLPDEFDESVKLTNFRTYEPRCGHGSSLSRSMHALVAARLGEEATAYRYLLETAQIDLSANAIESEGGVHIAALGGLWQAVVLGFGGVSMSGEKLRIAPRLPKQWHGLAFRLCWQGRRILVHILADGRVVTTLESGDELSVIVHGEERLLRPLAHALA